MRRRRFVSCSAPDCGNLPSFRFTSEGSHEAACHPRDGPRPAIAAPLSAQTKRPFSYDDLAKFHAVSDPQRSPDGKWVAYTVSTTDVEKDKHNRDVWMVSWDGKEQVQLTSSKDNESTPRWSPDGKYLAFLASRGDEDEKKKGAQVWLLNRAGGEALQLTEIKGGIDDYAWSPDGKRLALVVNDPDPDDDPEKKEGWKRKTAPPIVIDRYAFKNDQSGYLGKLREHLYLFDVDGKKAEQLTTGTYDERNPSWSPDGTKIAFISERGAEPDRTNNSDVWVIEAKAGATPQQITTFPGPDVGRAGVEPRRQVARVPAGRRGPLLRVQPRQARRRVRPPAVSRRS